MIESAKDFLWVEKYRPKTVDDCLLPSTLKKQIRDLIKDNQIPTLMFSGRAGTGKTSLAWAICNQIGADVMYINASLETGIDTVRNKVVNFSSSQSLEGNLKVIILDECERFSDSAQDSLKVVQEQFHKTTRFIMITNNKSKIIDAIHSRAMCFDFIVPDAEKDKLTAQAFKKAIGILKAEDVTFDMKVVASMVARFYPDMRRLINELQRFSASGTISAEAGLDVTTSFDELIDGMRGKKFVDVRRWIARNADIDPLRLYKYFYDNLLGLFVPKATPNIILILAQYQNYSTSSIDQEINSMAAMVEIMGAAEWK